MSHYPHGVDIRSTWKLSVGSNTHPERQDDVVVIRKDEKQLSTTLDDLRSLHDPSCPYVQIDSS